MIEFIFIFGAIVMFAMGSKWRDIQDLITGSEDLYLCSKSDGVLILSVILALAGLMAIVLVVHA